MIKKPISFQFGLNFLLYFVLKYSPRLFADKPFLHFFNGERSNYVRKRGFVEYYFTRRLKIKFKISKNIFGSHKNSVRFCQTRYPLTAKVHCQCTCYLIITDGNFVAKICGKLAQYCNLHIQKLCRIIVVYFWNVLCYNNR